MTMTSSSKIMIIRDASRLNDSFEFVQNFSQSKKSLSNIKDGNNESPFYYTSGLSLKYIIQPIPIDQNNIPDPH